MDVGELERNAEAAAKLLKAISNPRRLMILCRLAEGEKTVGQLEVEMKIRQPQLSQQLARLRGDGIVMTRRHSRSIYYTLADGRAEQLIGHLYDMFCTSRPAPQPNRAVSVTD